MKTTLNNSKEKHKCGMESNEQVKCCPGFHRAGKFNPSRLAKEISRSANVTFKPFLGCLNSPSGLAEDWAI